MKSLINHFEIIEDPRDIRGKKHDLANILVMTVYGILCGYTDFLLSLTLSNKTWLWFHDNFAGTPCKNSSLSNSLANLLLKYQ